LITDGENYLVAWIDDRAVTQIDGAAITDPHPWSYSKCCTQVRAARIRESDGALLDGPPDTGGLLIATSSGGSHFPVSVAYSSDTYLVSWGIGGPSGGEIRAKRLRKSDMQLLDGDAQSAGILIDQQLLQPPPIDTIGGQSSFFLTAVGSPGPSAGGSADARGYLIGTNGLLQSLGSIGDTGVSGGDVEEGFSSVSAAFDGQQFLAAYGALDTSLQPPGNRLLGVRFREADGARIDSQPIVISSTLRGGYDTSSNRVVRLRAEFDGASYLAAWEDTRGAIYWSRIDPVSGAVLDQSAGSSGIFMHPAPIPLAPRWTTTWDLTPVSSGQAVLAYQTYQGTGAEFAKSRIFSQVVGF
jgi:hypothetical protein